MIDAVVFDLDGVIIDSEQLWDEVREGLARERGGRWSEQAQADMMGMSSTEWSRYMHEVVGLAEPPEEINREVVRRMLARYSEHLPLIDGAVDAVERLAAHWPLGVASSSNRELIDHVLELSGLASYFKVSVSSEETVTSRYGVRPESSRTWSISSRFDDEATPIGHFAASRLTAATAPSISGRCSE